MSGGCETFSPRAGMTERERAQVSDDASDEVTLAFCVLGRPAVLEVKRFGERVGFVTVNIFGPHRAISVTMTALEAEKLHEALGRLFSSKTKAGD
jgi:hypothetical protein